MSNLGSIIVENYYIDKTAALSNDKSVKWDIEHRCDLIALDLNRANFIVCLEVVDEYKTTFKRYCHSLASLSASHTKYCVAIILNRLYCFLCSWTVNFDLAKGGAYKYRTLSKCLNVVNLALQVSQFYSTYVIYYSTVFIGQFLAVSQLSRTL